MELLSLGSDFQPDSVVENYSSLIWTERFADAGDFELKTGDIDATIAQLPTGSMVSLRDGFDCMIVESHLIEEDEETGEETLTVLGRSFETFLENRVAHEGQARMFTADGDPEMPFPPGYDWDLTLSGEAASKYAYEVIRYKTMIASDTVNYVPNLTCTINANATLAAGRPRKYITVQIGSVYERVLEILAIDTLGIRSILPAVGSSTMNLHIHRGNVVSDSVIFSVLAGHFNKTSYAWSIRDFRNAGIAHSEWDWTYNAGTSGTGLNRRIGWVDASDITRPTAPGAGTNVDEKELQSRISTMLRQKRQLTGFSGEVAPDIPYKYGTDYYLGDIVRLVGKYNLNQIMRITEYTRIEDKNGEKVFPTLEIP